MINISFKELLMPQIRTVITGTGSFIPSNIKTNRDFINQPFYGEDGLLITTPSEEIVDKLEVSIKSIENDPLLHELVKTERISMTKALRDAIKSKKIPVTIFKMPSKSGEPSDATAIEKAIADR